MKHLLKLGGMTPDEIFDEAENRIYVEKAVLAVLLAGK